jgi:non-ribosomal peptide synthetase component E (peptide arylation enzyme)
MTQAPGTPPDGQIRHARDVFRPAQIAQFKESGFWKDRLLSDYLRDNVNNYGSETAIVDARNSITWKELDDRADKVAALFIGLGLQSADFVALQLPNWIEFVECYLGAQRAGLRVLALMTIYRDRDVEYMLGKCAARAYVVPGIYRGFDFGHMAERVSESLPSLDHVIVVGAHRRGQLNYELAACGAAAAPQELAARRPDPDSVSHIGFTSGTTALPKAVTHTHNTDLVPPVWLCEVLGLSHDTPVWMPSPVVHTTGLLFGVMDSIVCGAKLILQDAWDPQAALELIARERAYYTVSATPFIAAMVRQPNLSEFDLTSFRFFVSGGAPIPGSLVREAEQKLGWKLLRVFGHSEAPLHTINRPDDPMERLTTADGLPMAGAEIRVVDPERRAVELPAGITGEYATRGPHVFLGYYADREQSLESRDSDGWFYSEDLCRIDADGYVTYLDRIKDIVNRGGLKISALEIEVLVAGHPAVSAAAVVAVPDERLGERAAACVVLREGRDLDLESLGAYLKSRGITTQKWPEQLLVMDTLPVTPTGKVQKTVLRSELQRLAGQSPSRA